MDFELIRTTIELNVKMYRYFIADSNIVYKKMFYIVSVMCIPF